jgi:hypothetical protein
MADKTQDKYIKLKYKLEMHGVLSLLYKGIDKNFVSGSLLTTEKQNF